MRRLWRSTLELEVVEVAVEGNVVKKIQVKIKK